MGRTDVEIEAAILWPPNVKSDSLEKTLMLEKIEGRKRRGQQRMTWLDGITDSMDMNLGKPDAKSQLIGWERLRAGGEEGNQG